MATDLWARPWHGDPDSELYDEFDDYIPPPSSPDWEAWDTEHARKAEEFANAARAAAAWDPDEHPRDELGRFTATDDIAMDESPSPEMSGDMQRVLGGLERIPRWQGTPEARAVLTDAFAQMAPAYDDHGMERVLLIDRIGAPPVWGENEGRPGEVYDDATARMADGWAELEIEDRDAVEELWMLAGGAAASWQEGSGVQQLRSEYDDWVNARDDMPIDEYARLQAAGALFTLLDEAAPYDGTLYREMFVESYRASELLDEMVPGTVLDASLAGWSSSEEVANIFGQSGAEVNDDFVRDLPLDEPIGVEEYADAALVKPMTGSDSDQTYIVHMVLDPGVQALPLGLLSVADPQGVDIGERYAWQREWLVGEPLRVYSVDVYEPQPVPAEELSPLVAEEGDEMITPGTIVVHLTAAS